MNIIQKLKTKIKTSHENWEAICKKCGLCCYEKETSFFSSVIKLSLPCEYLNPNTKQCQIYEKRFSICRFCSKVTIWHALFSPALPSTCGYVERYRNFRLIKPATIEK